MCLGQKPFNSPPFPAIWRDLRQTLSLAVAVWGSQENKLRSLFFKGRLCFSDVLCFEGLTVWYHYGLPSGDAESRPTAPPPQYLWLNLGLPSRLLCTWWKKLNERPNIPPTLPVGCGLTSKKKIWAKKQCSSLNSWNSILNKKKYMVWIKECTWKLDYDQFWFGRDWKM